MNAPAVLLLISSLGSPGFATRERTQADLQSLVRVGGLGLVEGAARTHPDAEVRARCRRVATADLERRLFIPEMRGLSLRGFGQYLDEGLFAKAARATLDEPERGGRAYIRLLLEKGYSEEQVRREVVRARATEAELARQGGT